MGTMLETIQNAIIQDPEAEAQPGTTRPDGTEIETQLTEEISSLWSDHVRLSANHKTTAKELRQIRASLAERLAAMKSLLSRPGRLGQWRGWLRQQGIPRSTADRLVSRHAETLVGDNGNVPTGAISEPGEANAEKLARNVWLRFGKLLTTHESILRFIGCIVTASGVAHEQREEGLVIFNLVGKPADDLPGSVSVAQPVPQPSDEAPAITKEPRQETVATAMAAEDVAGIADASNGDVL
jgi:hypothetical protein